MWGIAYTTHGHEAWVYSILLLSQQTGIVAQKLLIT